VVVPYDEKKPQSGTAQIIAKTNIQDITDPDNPVSIAGNAMLDLVMKDNGEPVELQSITVWSKDDELLFSSRWDGLKTLLQELDGGNLQVH